MDLKAQQMLKYWATISCFCCVTAVRAQTTISGRVSYQDGTAMINASVKIRDSAKGPIIHYALSDLQGNYRISLPGLNRRYRMECSFVGYKNHIFVVETRDARPEIFMHNITMDADTGVLNEIHVQANPPVRVSGDTTIFRADAFRQGNEANVGDLVNNLPGFSVEDGRIKYNGRSVSRVLVEGEDLFGQDYTTITRNVSSRGIEKIELIDNYKDNTYLSTRLQKGQELVVNLRFDKKFLYRVVGSAELGSDPSLQYYKARGNLISFMPKLKFVTTVNVNTTGFLGSELAGDITGFPAAVLARKEGINFDADLPYTVSPIAQSVNIRSAVIPGNKLVFNHSRLITNNALYKPSGKWQVRNIVQVYKDVYSQQRAVREDYAIPGNSFTVHNNQYLEKDIPVFKLANEVIYSPSPGLQVIHRLSFQTMTEEDSVGETKQVLNVINSHLSNTTRGLRQQLNVVKMLDSNLLFSISIQRYGVLSKQQTSVFPSGIFESLTADSSVRRLRSLITDDYSNWYVDVKASWKKGPGTYSLKLFYRNTGSVLNSDALLFAGDSSQPANSTTFLTRSRFRMLARGAELETVQQLSKHVTLQLNQKFEGGELSLANAGLSDKISRYLYYEPAIELRARINNMQSFGIRYGLQNRFADPYDLFAAYIVSSAGSVVKGIHQLNTGQSAQFTLNYFYADAVRRKITGYAAITYMHEPLLYLANSLPNVFFTLNTRISFPGTGKTMNLLGSLSKYVSVIKSQVSADFNAIRHNSYYAANNSTGPFAFANTGIQLKLKTIVAGQLITSLGWQGNFMSQDFDKGTAQYRSQSGQTHTCTAAFSYSIRKSLVFTGRFQRIIQHFGSDDQQLGLADMALKYSLEKPKLSLELSGNNIFSPGRLSTTVYTSISTITQSVKMLPAYVMLLATVDF
jgi:hypothetical protein